MTVTLIGVFMSEVKEITPRLKQRSDNYKKDIDAIKEHFANLWFTKKVNNKLIELVKNNRNLQEPHVFWFWLKNLYNSTIVLEICKLIDKDEDYNSISLMNLLNSLKGSGFLTENNYFQLFKSYDETNMFLDNEIRDWYKETIKENNSTDFNEMIEKDINALKQCTEKIKKYRDTIIAHFDKKALKDEYRKSFDFDLDEIDKICLFIETLIQKYNSLIYQGAELLSFNETIDYNNYDLSTIFKTEEK
jgi:hypothetical protein